MAIDRVDINRTKDQLIDAIDYIDNNGEALDHAISVTEVMDVGKAMGVYSIAYKGMPQSNGSIAIGNYASVNNDVGSGSIAIGGHASTAAQSAIQIGTGTNDTANTVQIKSTQILNSNGEVPISSIENATDIQATLDKVENVEAEDLEYAVDYVNTNHASLTNASNVCSSIRNDGIGIIGSALGNDSIAIGDEATTRNGSTNAIVIGKGAKVGAGATGEASIAIGSIANVQGDNTIAIGRNSNVLSNYGVALGDNTTVLTNSTNAVALGKGASVSAENAVQIGQGTNSTSNTLQFKDITIINSSGKIPSSIIEGGGGGGTTDYVDLTNKPQINGYTLNGNKTGAELGLFDAPLIFTNVSATFTANSDADYSDYSYKAVLTCTGVTASMLATVIFSEAQATSGNYALTCVTGTDSVTIYSNDNTAITIPSIIAGAPLEVEISSGSGHNYSTDEQVVGTWVDGKPLYEKTYYFNNKVLGTNDTNGGLTHGLVNIDMAFVEKALWKFTNDNNYWNDISTIKTTSGSSPSYFHGQMTVGDNTFYDTYNGNTMNASTSRSYIVVVRYTKTIDEAVNL